MSDAGPGGDGEGAGDCPVCGQPIPVNESGHVRLPEHIRNECEAAARCGRGEDS